MKSFTALRLYCLHITATFHVYNAQRSSSWTCRVALRRSPPHGTPDNLNPHLRRHSVLKDTQLCSRRLGPHSSHAAHTTHSNTAHPSYSDSRSGDLCPRESQPRSAIPPPFDSPSLSHLPDCDVDHHVLQLSVYKERAGERKPRSKSLHQTVTTRKAHGHTRAHTRTRAYTSDTRCACRMCMCI